MCHILRVVIVAVVLGVSLAKVSPDFFTPCTKWTSECLKTAIQASIPFFSKGIPSLGVQPTDPLLDDNVSLELPGAFKVQLNNGSLTGLRKCVVDTITYENDQADLDLRCNVTIKGRYKANGQILIVSINGDGDAKIKTTNIILSAHIKFHDTVRDGIKYYEVKSYTIGHKFAGKVSFSLTNLFRGNPELSDAVLQFLNQNWKQISEEFGGPILDRLIKLVFSNVKEFFHNVPKDELMG